jgi:hypothetical protein
MFGKYLIRGTIDGKEFWSDKDVELEIDFSDSSEDSR